MRFLLAHLFLFSFLLAAPQDEMLIIQELIDTTKKNLDNQQDLLQMMMDFKDARESFIADPDSSKLATQLVKRAMRLQNHLMKEHLTHLFSNDFLTELAFYSQVGRQIAR